MNEGAKGVENTKRTDEEEEKNREYGKVKQKRSGEKEKTKITNKKKNIYDFSLSDKVARRSALQYTQCYTKSIVFKCTRINSQLTTNIMSASAYVL